MSKSKSLKTDPPVGVDSPTTFVIGENLIDLLVDDIGDVKAVPGGGPFNVARTIARLGQNATLLSRLSSDAFGNVMRNVLAKDQVSLVFEESINLPTALAVVDVSSPAPRYSFHLRDSAAFEITSREGIDSLLSNSSVSAIYLGTLGLVVEPMATMMEDVVAAAPVSALVLLDPNCRPSATPDHEAYRRRINRLLRRVDIVKVSIEDLEFLSPRMTRNEATTQLLTGGAAIVIVTDGPNPFHAYSSDDEVIVDVPYCRIEDTVGAGDALVGAFLAWCAVRGITREQARDLSVTAEGIGTAVQIASITCSRRGAEPPWYWEVQTTENAWHE